MAYEVLLRTQARKEFLALPHDIAKKITVGDYRILYDIDDSTRKVIAYRIKHRREAYR